VESTAIRAGKPFEDKPQQGFDATADGGGMLDHILDSQLGAQLIPGVGLGRSQPSLFSHASPGSSVFEQCILTSQRATTLPPARLREPGGR